MLGYPLLDVLVGFPTEVRCVGKLFDGLTPLANLLDRDCSFCDLSVVFSVSKLLDDCKWVGSLEKFDDRPNSPIHYSRFL